MGYETPTTPAVGDLVTAHQGAVIAEDLATGPNMGTPTSTATTGTPTSTTVETRDAVLGGYTFTAIAGRRYQAILAGSNVYCSVAAERYFINIRNGGGSTPTASSPVVAQSQVTSNATGSWNAPGAILGTFAPGAGTVTLGVFLVRDLGSSGLAQFQNPVGVRELYAVDIGPA